MPAKMPQFEHKLIAVDSDGHSHLLDGDPEQKRAGVESRDNLPFYLSMGWKVINMTPFSNSDKILILLQKDSLT